MIYELQFTIYNLPLVNKCDVLRFVILPATCILHPVTCNLQPVTRNP
jgi:hypothetical protein